MHAAHWGRHSSLPRYRGHWPWPWPPRLGLRHERPAGPSGVVIQHGGREAPAPPPGPGDSGSPPAPTRAGTGRWRSALRPSPPWVHRCNLRQTASSLATSPSRELLPAPRRAWPLAPPPSTDAPGHDCGASPRRGRTTHRGTRRLDGSRLPGERASTEEIVQLWSPFSVAPGVKRS